MTTTRKFWIPAGSMTAEQALVLAVPSLAKPDPQVFQSLLGQKLHRLIDQSPQEAQSVLEMSQEQAPELYQIAQDQPPDQWAQSLMSSDSLGSLLTQVDWSQPGQVKILPPQDLRSLMEQLP